MFLRQTLAAAASDPQNAMAEKEAAKARQRRQLLAFFATGDTSHDGMLSLDEFRDLLANPEFQHTLTTFDVAHHDAEKLFLEIATDLDGDGEDEVKEEAFIEGIVSAQQGVKGLDMIGLMHQQQQT